MQRFMTILLAAACCLIAMPAFAQDAAVDDAATADAATADADSSAAVEADMEAEPAMDAELDGDDGEPTAAEPLPATDAAAGEDTAPGNYRLVQDYEPQFAARETVLGESPRNWTAHALFGAYKLSEIDSEFDGSGPAETVFGTGREFFFLLGFERLLWQEFGTIGLEGQAGYWHITGKGLYRDGGQSADDTTFHMVPMKLSAVYRFTETWDRWHVPLVPFVKFGLDYYIWWITNQGGGVSEYTPDDGGGSSKALGGTFGFHVSYGLQLALDIMDPELADQFDQEVGVNTTYLFFEGTYAKVNDFFAGSSFDLTDHYWMGGILFEF